ncbi:MAG: CHASE2 domain-containing protein [Candidatus Saccharicenans sp.]
MKILDKKPAARQKFRNGLLAGLAVFFLSAVLYFTGWLRVAEWKTWDLRLNLWARPEKADKNIVIVLIDQYSLDYFSREQQVSWPWPRQLYAALVDYLKKAQARAVFFDLILSESSAYGVEDDRALAEAIRRAGNVFLALSLSRKETGYGEVSAERLEKFSFVPDFAANLKLPEAASATLPVQVLLDSAAGAGNVLFEPDADGIFRRLPLAIRYRTLVLPSIPLALARAAGISQVDRTRLDSHGAIILNYHGPSGTYRSYSVAAIINSWAQMEEGKTPQINPEEFRDKIVLVGASAPGLLDLRPSPLSPVCPGVEMQATALDNLIHRDSFRETGPVALIVLVFFFAVLVAMLNSFLPHLWQQVGFLLVALAVPVALTWIAFRSGFWLNLVVPEAAVLLSFISTSLVNYAVEGRQRRFIKNVFSHYLSPQVIEKIVDHPELLKLGGEKREVTSFFSDVAGFTSISERLSPEELVSFLNEYLSEMTDIILEEGGTLDKYEGDAIIAFWNAPLDQPDHARRACRAALRCQARLAQLQPRFEALTGRPVRARIGLNSGPAVVGNMGSTRRFDYTAMGDTINLASRLESAAKQYRVSILMGQNTWELVREYFVARPVDLIRVVGKTEPVAVYELLSEREAATPELEQRIELFSRARALYLEGRWDEAQKLFESLSPDPLSAVYAERCQLMKLNPPPEDWDGIFILKEK